MKGANKQSQVDDQVIISRLFLSPHPSTMEVSRVTVVRTELVVRVGLLFSGDTNAIGRRPSF